MEEQAENLYITTDDGSYGRKGMVTEVITELVEKEGRRYDTCVAIGPMIMMKGCADTTRPYNIKTMVSLNPLMVDGTGMCGGCRVKIGDKVKFACVDGPDFDGHDVDFDDMMNRLRRYTKEERQAMEHWEDGHDKGCRLQKAVDKKAGKVKTVKPAKAATGA